MSPIKGLFLRTESWGLGLLGLLVFGFWAWGFGFSVYSPLLKRLLISLACYDLLYKSLRLHVELNHSEQHPLQFLALD
jgi:hypothetical protein